jgi:hypothetical protein
LTIDELFACGSQNSAQGPIRASGASIARLMARGRAGGTRPAQSHCSSAQAHHGSAAVPRPKTLRRHRSQCLVRAVIEQWSASALTQTAQGRPVLRHQPAKSLRFRRSGNACTISALNLLNVSEHKLLNTSLRPKRNLYFKNKARRSFARHNAQDRRELQRGHLRLVELCCAEQVSAKVTLGHFDHIRACFIEAAATFASL